MSKDPSPFGSPNPFGQNPYGAPNPYTSPNYAGPPGGQPPVVAILMGPAIGLLLTGILGMVMSRRSAPIPSGLSLTATGILGTRTPRSGYAKRARKIRVLK